MADSHSKSIRSYNMSRIRCRDTKPELIVRRLLFAQGFRFKVCDSKLPGKPDIVLPKYKTVIFVHGCFWHQHKGCKRAVLPQSNAEYWLPKLQRNAERFKEVRRLLRKAGWQVIVVWECQIKNLSRLETRLRRLLLRSI